MKNKMKYFIPRLLILVFLIALFFLISAFFKNEDDASRVCFGEKCLNIEIADEYNERQKGLMFREELDGDSGMLFIFESSGEYDFWMKNTLIPLDIIWISEDMKIVDIQGAAPCVEDPCRSYIPKGNAKYVLEVNSGFAEENGIDIGDEVNLFLY